jgi:hypothetical protein
MHWLYFVMYNVTVNAWCFNNSHSQGMGLRQHVTINLTQTKEYCSRI